MATTKSAARQPQQSVDVPCGSSGAYGCILDPQTKNNLLVNAIVDGVIVKMYRAHGLKPLQVVVTTKNKDALVLALKGDDNVGYKLFTEKSAAVDFDAELNGIGLIHSILSPPRYKSYLTNNTTLKTLTYGSSSDIIGVTISNKLFNIRKKETRVVERKGAPTILYMIVQAYCKSSNLPLGDTKISGFLEIIELVRILHVNGVVHRDITLDNILKCDGHYRLIDFGLTSKIKDAALGDPKRRCDGSRYYMDPFFLRTYCNTQGYAMSSYLEDMLVPLQLAKQLNDRTTSNDAKAALFKIMLIRNDLFAIARSIQEYFL